MKKLDLLNKKFGKWTVIKKSERRGYWLCRCECGVEKEVLTDNLKGGKSKSCGSLECKGKKQAENLAGQRFNNLVVLERAEGKYGKVLWKCICDCGTETITTSDNLKSEHTKSCGCLRKEPADNRLNLVGQRFGKLVVLKFIGIRNGKSDWLCECDCGNEVFVTGYELTGDNITSCICTNYECCKGFKYDLTDERFGRLSVLKFSGNDKQGHALWLCKCDCGNEKVIAGRCLTSNSTKSCGCIKSFQEIDLLNFIQSIYKDKIIHNDRTLIKPLEIDILLPDLKIGIEYCGLYWHSEDRLGKNYHLNKLNLCLNKGYNLITIFEDEWINKRSIVESRLKSLLNTNNQKKVYARKCIIKEIPVSEAKPFCNENHLQGYGNSLIKLGAFFENELVSVMLFSKPSISKGNGLKIDGLWELNRFCSKINYSIIGIASKFVSRFKKNYEWNEVFSFADRRWSIGNVYETIGFSFTHNSIPSYFYFSGDKIRHHRYNYRKDILLKRDKSFTKEMTEIQMAHELGLERIYDCGTIKYNMKKELTNESNSQK